MIKFKEILKENLDTSDCLPSLIWYHNTSLENAKSIIKSGFNFEGKSNGINRRYDNIIWLSLKPAKEYGYFTFKIKLTKKSFSIDTTKEESPSLYQNFNTDVQAIYFPYSKYLAVKDLSIIESVKILTKNIERYSN